MNSTNNPLNNAPTIPAMSAVIDPAIEQRAAHRRGQGVKRIDPRRPFIVTAQGRKRIVLGAAASSGETGAAKVAGMVPSTGDEHLPRTKAPRLSTPGAHHLMVFAHSVRGGLDQHARQAIAAAALLADDNTAVVLVVFGSLSDDAAAFGADRIVVLPAFDAARFAPLAELTALHALIDAFQPARILAADRPPGDGDLGRRLAAARGLSIATHVIELSHQGVAVYRAGGTTLTRRPLPRVILLARDAVDARLPFVGLGLTEERGEQHGAPAAAAQYRDLGIEPADLTRLALEEAEMIVSAGNGVRDVATFTALGDALGAAIAASRVAVDDGRFARDKQVGATGKTVSANLYMAIGISGAVQHLQGIKDCRHVIAINLDASAPIVKRADLSVIDDAQNTMLALVDELTRARSESQCEPRRDPRSEVGARLAQGALT